MAEDSRVGVSLFCVIISCHSLSSFCCCIHCWLHWHRRDVSKILWKQLLYCSLPKSPWDCLPKQSGQVQMRKEKHSLWGESVFVTKAKENEIEEDTGEWSRLKSVLCQMLFLALKRKTQTTRPPLFRPLTDFVSSEQWASPSFVQSFN